MSQEEIVSLFQKEPSKEKILFIRKVCQKYLSLTASAYNRGKEFKLSLFDIVHFALITHCEYTGVELSDDKKSANYPTIERVDSNEGYTKENCIVVARWVNLAKSNMTTEQFEFLRSLSPEQIAALETFVKDADFDKLKKLKGC